MKKRPIRILHVIHGLTTGGAEVDLLRKSRYLVQRYGDHTTICCLMRRGELALAAEESGIEVIGPLMTDRYDIRAFKSLRRLLTTGNFDLIHSHLYASNLVTWLTMKTIPFGGRIGWIASEHAMAERWNRHTTLRLTHGIASSARRFLTPSDAAAASYIAIGVPASAISVLPNAIELDQSDVGGNTSTPPQMRLRLGFADTDFVVGTISRLEPLKNLRLLFEAMEPLSVELVVVGDGSERLALENLVRSKGWETWIHFLGRRDDIDALLSSFDLFALASSTESFGMVVAEALLAGTPVVATVVGGIPEVTEHGSYAALVLPGDVQALRAATLGVMAEPQAAQQQALAGRDFVRRTYSVNVVTEQLRNLYLHELALEDSSVAIS